MTQLYFTGTQEEVTAANQQINTNCGFPDTDTETWSIPQSSYSDPTFYFVEVPPPDGYKNGIGEWTQSQMIANVINVEIQEAQSNWWPPV